MAPLQSPPSLCPTSPTSRWLWHRWGPLSEVLAGPLGPCGEPSASCVASLEKHLMCFSRLHVGAGPSTQLQDSLTHVGCAPPGRVARHSYQASGCLPPLGFPGCADALWSEATLKVSPGLPSFSAPPPKRRWASPRAASGSLWLRATFSLSSPSRLSTEQTASFTVALPTETSRWSCPPPSLTLCLPHTLPQPRWGGSVCRVQMGGTSFLLWFPVSPAMTVVCPQGCG